MGQRMRRCGRMDRAVRTEIERDLLTRNMPSTIARHYDQLQDTRTVNRRRAAQHAGRRIEMDPTRQIAAVGLFHDDLTCAAGARASVAASAAVAAGATRAASATVAARVTAIAGAAIPAIPAAAPIPARAAIRAGSRVADRRSGL